MDASQRGAQTTDNHAYRVANLCIALAPTGPDQIEKLERTILEHHKPSASGADPSWLVEPFRKADWIDVTRGTFTFGLSNRTVERILSTWPSAGFHRRLLQLVVTRLWTNPLTPLPMLKR
jgi:hypothetical protein